MPLVGGLDGVGVGGFTGAGIIGRGWGDLPLVGVIGLPLPGPMFSGMPTRPDGLVGLTPFAHPFVLPAGFTGGLI